jgi:AcrR family transcriptional regulator
MSEVKRMGLRDRRATILGAAIKVAEREGYALMRRATVAEAAGCSDALVSIRFGNFEKLRVAVVKEAIRTTNLTIISQALTARDKRAARIPADTRALAIRHALSR